MNVLYFIFMHWSQERSSCLCINIWWLCFEADLWQQWVSDFPGSDSCHIPGQQSCQRAWILTQSFQFPVTPEHWIHKLLLLRSWVWLHLFAQGRVCSFVWGFLLVIFTGFGSLYFGANMYNRNWLPLIQNSQRYWISATAASLWGIDVFVLFNDGKWLVYFLNRQ